MLQGLKEIREQDGFLHVRLRREEDFDPYIYEQIRMDEECLQPLQQQKHTFRYEPVSYTHLTLPTILLV